MAFNDLVAEIILTVCFVGLFVSIVLLILKFDFYVLQDQTGENRAIFLC